jgi:DNA-binding response OmpR family regulator
MNVGRRVLVVDDDPAVRETVATLLRGDGFAVLEAPDGERGVELARLESPDLAVLEVTLPGISGLEVCRQLRRFTDIPVVFLTAMDSEVDELVGFAAGGDDYVIKPFAPRVLSARIEALMRRAGRTTPVVVTSGTLGVDLTARVASVGGKPVDLSKNEFDLLAVLASQAGKIVSRDQVMEGVWGPKGGDPHVLDVTVSRLRTRLADAGAPPKVISTHRGLGYRLNVA